MKKILAVLLVIASMPAFAVQGSLMNCVYGTTPSGNFGYIGNYMLANGVAVTLYFPVSAGTCPIQVNVP